MDESLKLPELPNPLLMVRKIRGCEGEVAAQLVLEQYGLACARAALEEAAKVCDETAESFRPISDMSIRSIGAAEDCAERIRNIKVGE